MYDEGGLVKDSDVRELVYEKLIFWECFILVIKILGFLGIMVDY